MTPQATSGSLFGLGAITSALSGIGKYESGQQEKKAYDYNADVVLANMRNQMAANEQQYATRVGQQASAYASSGVDISSGSPLLIMAATRAMGAKQGKQIEQQGTQESLLQRYYGKIAAWSGTVAGIGSFLSGFSNSASAYYGATAKLPAPTVNPQAPYGSNSD